MSTAKDGGSAENAGAIFCPLIAYMDVGMSNLSGTKFDPEHRRSLASMPPRHTVHPEHKKGATKGGSCSRGESYVKSLKIMIQ